MLHNVDLVHKETNQKENDFFLEMQEIKAWLLYVIPHVVTAKMFRLF